jgi:hypothetical protein
MDNSTLISLTKDLIETIEACFDQDDCYTKVIYECKDEDTTLLKYIQAEQGRGTANLWSFYLAYERLKKRIELLEEMTKS